MWSVSFSPYFKTLLVVHYSLSQKPFCSTLIAAKIMQIFENLNTWCKIQLFSKIFVKPSVSKKKLKRCKYNLQAYATVQNIGKYFYDLTTVQLVGKGFLIYVHWQLLYRLPSMRHFSWTQLLQYFNLLQFYYFRWHALNIRNQRPLSSCLSIPMFIGTPCRYYRFCGLVVNIGCSNVTEYIRST